MELTAENVNRIFLDSLFREEELVDGKPTVDPIITVGVTVKVGFHPERIAQHTTEIVEMLNCLPEPFKKSSKSGGWSFLNACYDSNEQQWTSLHRTIDELVCLGLATKKLEFCAPREFWSVLSGGMPYFVIN